ncbi:hypothetical protein SAMN05443246_3231 [Paenibacillus sp. GP183]|nr:hypothetical protein SAMN05443246_3231 [Paenibacillus sp. GP183]
MLPRSFGNWLAKAKMRFSPSSFASPAFTRFAFIVTLRSLFACWSDVIDFMIIYSKARKKSNQRLNCHKIFNSQNCDFSHIFDHNKNAILPVMS